MESITEVGAVPLAQASVADNSEFSRFELSVDGELVGILSYVECAEQRGPAGAAEVALMHTVVKEQFGDRGWAAVLVRESLDMLRDNAVSIHPLCTYVQRFLAANTEYLPMVVDQAAPSSTITGA